MSLGFGLLSAQIPPGAPDDWTGAYADVLDYTEFAERLGYTSVWTTEHHFVDDGYMPSLLVTSAAMAARTSTIEIGTGVVLAPLHDPLRLAEDAATVQLISGGRFTLGVGLGWSRTEYGALGVDMSQRGAAMSEMLEILPKAWSGKPFAHAGPVYDIPRLAVRPVPQTPIPVVVGGGAEVAVRRAARLADGFFSNAPIHKFVDQVRWAREEREKAGLDPDDFRWVFYSVMYPCDDAETGWEEIKDHAWAMTWKYSDMEASTDRSGPPPDAPPMRADLEQKIRERSVIVDTPERIVERLHQLRDEAGVPVDFVARSYFATLPGARQRELMERLATDVAPHL